MFKLDTEVELKPGWYVPVNDDLCGPFDNEWVASEYASKVPAVLSGRQKEALSLLKKLDCDSDEACEKRKKFYRSNIHEILSIVFEDRYGSEEAAQAYDIIVSTLMSYEERDK